MTHKTSTQYYLNQKKEFVIENYNNLKPFSSFLPAIAGLYGKPMWAFYVNRGQCIATFGINNKDNSIMEFRPANKAYMQTSLQSFRTFLKIKNGNNGETTYYEPFQDFLSDKGYETIQKMFITSYDLKLEEVNKTLGIKTEVMYCTLPGENLSSLIRKVRISNISNEKLEIEALDGMPQIIPYYLTNNDMKNESNLRQAWMGVEHYDTIPFYKINVLPYDTPEITLIKGGNFYLNFGYDSNNVQFFKTMIEPALIFGKKTDFLYPEAFIRDDFRFPDKQVDIGITPCGFGHKKLSLDGGESNETYTLIGNCDQYEKLTDYVHMKLQDENYIIDKINENKLLIEGLKDPIFTASSSEEFDLYCGQTFMDNFLRGGYPVSVGNGKHIYYIYSRKHGDLEREYNFFQVDSTYYSQGNSNFRDVNQNRRNDVSFFPFIGDSNIRTFYNLLQLDGFNPLVLKGSRFLVEDARALKEIIHQYMKADDYDTIREYLKTPFTPGGLLSYLEQKEIIIAKTDLDEFLNRILSISSKEDVADFLEGYWVDHWTYNTDLLEQYNAIFPDKTLSLLLNERSFTYYDNDEAVKPRNKKYVLTCNGVRQLDALAKIGEKGKMIKNRKNEQYKVRVEYGEGGIYYCTLLSKIICLLVTKMASLDPEGVGIEMEANKPGWCDALNGLPAIIGSSINESTEAKRLALVILDIFKSNNIDQNAIVKMPEEVFGLFGKISSLLEENPGNFKYWDLSRTAMEDYREKTFFGLSGVEEKIEINTLFRFLNSVIRKVDKGLEKAFNKEEGVYYTYFINEVTEYEIIQNKGNNLNTNENGYPYVKALKFKQRPIPYFIEGPVHVLRTEEDGDRARELHNAIKHTGLYDNKLGMYKVNDNIMEETKEIGRQNIFPRGWLENEAVFLHMEYKYFLELLRCGLYDEFFECFKSALIPFLNPEVYGRSILENSSFIASSVHVDEKAHGTGFVSRLTGASAELLSMWLYMTSGKKPFYLNEEKELCLEFKPVIPGWLFSKEKKEVEEYRDMKCTKMEIPANCFAYNFLGKILVVCHNESRKDTFGQTAARISKMIIQKDTESIPLEGSVIPMPYSQQIRDGFVYRIDILLE